MSNLLNAVLNYGGAASLFVVLVATVIEITPIKVNPIKWLGSRFNATAISHTDELADELKRIDAKIDQHVAEDYRNQIMSFQNECVGKKPHTKEQFARAINMCKRYETYIETNNLDNGEADEAIEYIRRLYQRRMEKNDFYKLEQ